MSSNITNVELFPDQLCIQYLGQMGFLFKFRGSCVLIDAYLSSYVDENCCTDAVVWRRNYDPPVLPEELGFVDYVFCTHAHEDHADPYTLRALAAACPKAKFYAPAPVAAEIAARGIGPERMTGIHSSGSLRLTPDIEVTPVPAAHEQLHTDASGDCFELGYIFRFGGLRLYHSGDCCPYDGLEERVRGCDIHILPVNGRDFYRRERCGIIGCFMPNEAIQLARDSGARLLIPAHIGLYDNNSVDPGVFAAELNRMAPYQAFHLFTPGEMYIYDPALIPDSERGRG